MYKIVNTKRFCRTLITKRFCRKHYQGEIKEKVTPYDEGGVRQVDLEQLKKSLQ